MTELFPDRSEITNWVVRWVSERRERFRNYGIAGALMVFAIGLAWSLHETPNLGDKFRLGPVLLLLAIGAPTSTVLNAVEMYAVSRIAGGPMTWRTSFELTIFSSAANMLPLPGGGIAKLAAMKAHGVGYGIGSAMILLTFAIWGGLAFLYSGAAFILLGEARLGGLFALCGSVLLAACGIGFARFAKWKLVLVIAAMRIVSFPLEAFRYLLALLAVGASISFLQSSIYVVATVIGSAVVFVPSGLGISEAVAALLSTFIGVSAGVGFVAATLGRIVRLAGLAFITLVALALRGGTRLRLENHSGSV